MGRANGVSAWNVVFSAMAMLSVITNCALLVFTSKEEGVENADFGFGVATEHLILFFVFCLQATISRLPGIIQKKLAKSDWIKQVDASHEGKVDTGIEHKNK